MMAVEQRKSRIIGDEIDLDGAESRHIDRVFHHARGRLVAYLGHLEGVAMQVNGMVVTAFVGHDQAIPLSVLGREQWIGCRPGLAIDGPAVCIRRARPALSRR